MATISDRPRLHARGSALLLGWIGLILLGCGSRQDRAFARILPGMAETEVRALVGDPLEEHRPPLPDSPDCARDASKALVYRQSKTARLWIYLDQNGRVLCDSLEMRVIQR